MAKTLLNAINEIFKRSNDIAGDANALTTLVDSARQHNIDVAIQVVNEGIIQLYAPSGVPQPKQQAEATVTLATGTRSYALAADLVTLRWPLIDKTNSQFIQEYAGGYNGLLLLDLEQDDTGLPQFGAISPVNGQLYLDRAPTSAENGNIYTYQYDKSLLVSAADDTVPFSDACFTAMVPAWVQLYKRELRGEFDGDLFKAAFGLASQIVTQAEPRDSYSPRC